MDGKGWPSVRAQILGDLVGDSLGAHEDKDFGTFLTDLIKMFDQLGPLLKVGTDRNDLTNVVVSCQFHRANIDLNKVAQEILNNGEHLPSTELE